MDITVAIDCMGGDHGPHVTVPAALNFLKSNSNVDIVLVGLRDAIEAELRVGGARSSPRLRVHQASEGVLMDESPALALRNKKDSSMRVAVGLLNIGEEDIKGNEVVKRAAELLRQSGLNFIGNIEGDGIYRGEADVVVCDGFVGNVMLKASEGMVQMVRSYIREEFMRSVLARLAGVIVMPALYAFRRRLDPRRFNGATLLGLRGIVVKSHGSADVFGFQRAIERATGVGGNEVLHCLR